MTSQLCCDVILLLSPCYESMHNLVTVAMVIRSLWWHGDTIPHRKILISIHKSDDIDNDSLLNITHSKVHAGKPKTNSSLHANYVDGLAQDCGISIMEIRQSCVKLSMYTMVWYMHRCKNTLWRWRVGHDGRLTDRKRHSPTLEDFVRWMVTLCTTDVDSFPLVVVHRVMSWGDHPLRTHTIDGYLIRCLIYGFCYRGLLAQV